MLHSIDCFETASVTLQNCLWIWNQLDSKRAYFWLITVHRSQRLIIIYIIFFVSHVKKDFLLDIGGGSRYASHEQVLINLTYSCTWKQEIFSSS